MGGDGEVETTEGMEGVGGGDEKGEGGGGVAAIHPRAHMPIWRQRKTERGLVFCQQPDGV